MQFIVGKFVAGMIYTALLILCMALVSLVLGVAIMGTGDLIVVRNTVYIFNEDDVLWRLVAAFGFGLAAMWTVAALSFLFSVLADNSIGPIVLTMTVIISFIVISAIDLSIFNAIDPFLFTNYMSDWKLFFESPVDTGKIVTSLLILNGHTLAFVGLAAWYFNKKDILT
jgi:ABC-2 type transport system permease protein